MRTVYYVAFRQWSMLFSLSLCFEVGHALFWVFHVNKHVSVHNIHDDYAFVPRSLILWFVVSLTWPNSTDKTVCPRLVKGRGMKRRRSVHLELSACRGVSASDTLKAIGWWSPPRSSLPWPPWKIGVDGKEDAGQRLGPSSLGEVSLFAHKSLALGSAMRNLRHLTCICDSRFSQLGTSWRGFSCYCF